MTSTTERPDMIGGDDPAAVLAFARAQKKAEDEAARLVLRAAVTFVSMHSTDSLVGPIDEWHESCFPLGGEGCPEVAEFAVVEFAAMLGKSLESGRLYLSRAVEGFYRLKQCWKRLEAGELEAWKLGIIAEQTLCLSPAAAAYVDRHVAHVAHRIGAAQLGRVIEEAKARFDPEAVEAERLAAAETRYFEVYTDQVTVAGRVSVTGELDLADALDVEHAVAADAEAQRLLGSTEPLDVRRSIALGNLARGHATLDLTDDDGETEQPARRTRQIVLHVHLSEAAIHGAGGLARVEGIPGPVTAEQVRTWCGAPDTTVTIQPVLDLEGHVQVGAYEASERLRDQTRFRDLTCVFPWCTRPAERCDHEHRVPHDPDRDDGGPTCSCNQAPVCRRHHRAKTTGGWTYVTVEPTVYLWRSPLGYEFLRDQHGSLDITPEPERRRLAREFRRHFGDTDPEP